MALHDLATMAVEEVVEADPQPMLWKFMAIEEQWLVLWDSTEKNIGDKPIKRLDLNGLEHAAIVGNKEHLLLEGPLSHWDIPLPG